jgi:hypothetical protein
MNEPDHVTLEKIASDAGNLLGKRVTVFGMLLVGTGRFSEEDPDCVIFDACLVPYEGDETWSMVDSEDYAAKYVLPIEDERLVPKLPDAFPGGSMAEGYFVYILPMTLVGCLVEYSDPDVKVAIADLEMAIIHRHRFYSLGEDKRIDFGE